VTVAEQIRERLGALAPAQLELLDQSARHAGHAGAAPGGNTHWKLTIVSAAFAGRPTVARHRMVYEALGELMQHPIHALEIIARAPGESGG
jgi:BolA protein